MVFKRSNYRLLGVGLISIAALAASARAMDDADLRHLLTRSGFGVSPDDYSRFKPMTFEQAVDTLLRETRTIAVSEPPEWADEPADLDRRAMREMTEEDRRERQNEFRRTQREQGQALKAWWYDEMLTTDSPLTERMTLFWHNHFTSGLRKVRSPQIMYRQNALLRLHALGNFRQLTHAVSQDPAMIVYLDNASNRRGKPNENFARELMELFTLGEGNYTEQDIRESARAFTGWGVNRREAQFNFQPRQHDGGIKTFRGRTGSFGGHEVIDIIFQDPLTAQYITEKLWREFISPTPDAREVERLSRVLIENNYEIKPLLRAMLLSPAFVDPVHRATLVKSPVELMVGALRTFDLDPEDSAVLVRQGRLLGQDLFDPPNVKGWPGGETWIDSNTYLLRRQMLQTVTRGPDPDRREMRGRGPRGGDPGARRGPAPRAESLSGLNEEQRKTMRRAAELRREGMMPPQIAAQLRKEGQDPQVLREVRQRRREAGQNMVAENRMSDDAGTMEETMEETPKAAAPPPAMRRAAPAQMPRLDVEAWQASLAGAGAADDANLVALFLPADPVEAEVYVDRKLDQRRLRVLLLDPVYQLK